MPGSTASVFSERDFYHAALQQDAGIELVVTSQGEFRAELIRLELLQMHLVTGLERLARIAYVVPSADLVRITLPTRGNGSLFWAGAALRPDEIVSHTASLGIYERTDGPCHWRTISLPIAHLLRYGRAMIGRAFGLPSGAHRWRPTSKALQRLSHLYDDATRMSRTQPLVLTRTEATRGLEQQLTDALIECMRASRTGEDATIGSRPIDVMDRFEGILRDYPHRAPAISDICTALGIPARTLRAYCKMHLGMGPHQYLHLRQMHLARRALRITNPATTRILDVANQYGFSAHGRFSSDYRKQFGERPSDTKRRAIR